MKEYKKRIELTKELINSADYILIGAGAGLSTAAGLKYSGEDFLYNYSEFIKKYNFTDLYSASFYDFDTPEEKWAFWAKLIKLNRFNRTPLNLYEKLYNVIKEKNYFIITTNVDGQFEKAGFKKEKIFAVQGDYAYLQCKKGCHNKIYYNEDIVKEWNYKIEDCKIPSSLVPKCPVCGKEMDMNLRKDANFIQDENWYKQAEKYENFLKEAQNKKLLLIEIGVGFNTPGIIRFPFEQMTYNNENTKLIRINKDYPTGSPEIENKLVPFNEDTTKIVQDISAHRDVAVCRII